MDVNPDNENLPSWAKKISVKMVDLWKQHEVDGPTCHVGSLINNPGATEESALKWRMNFKDLANKEFVGVDLFAGVNVDVVADLCDPEFEDKHGDLVRHFGLVVCRALLEHVQNPIAAAHNIEKLLRPGGHLYVAGPWVWGYHPYPDDYWRLSFSAYKVLFPNVRWVQWFYSGTKEPVGIEISDISHERKLFANIDSSALTGPASMISDRSMPYLNVGAVGIFEG